MDCGEDKPDDHTEYGNTVCCEVFRRDVTRFLEKWLLKKSILMKISNIK